MVGDRITKMRVRRRCEEYRLRGMRVFLIGIVDLVELGSLIFINC